MSWREVLGVVLAAVPIGGGLYMLVFKRVPPPAWTRSIWTGKNTSRPRLLGGHSTMLGTGWLIWWFGFALGYFSTTQSQIGTSALFVALLASSFVLLQQSTKPPTDKRAPFGGMSSTTNATCSRPC